MMDKEVAGHLFAIRYALGLAMRAIAHSAPGQTEAFTREMQAVAGAVDDGFRFSDDDQLPPDQVNTDFLRGMHTSFSELKFILHPDVPKA